MRKILMIPGPIEYESAVMNALSLPTISHSSKEFVSINKETLLNLMNIFGSAISTGIPFIISGSGTLGMEAATVNFIKRGSKVLVVNSGYFGDRFVDLFSRFTDKVDQIKPPLGEPADPKVVKEKLETNEYELMTVTHVDTSTGIRNDVKKIAELSRKTDTLLVVDAVCSAGGEALDMKGGIDVAFSASQKALGAPPGLTVGVVGSRAMTKMENVRPMTFFSDLRKWTAVSKAILDGRSGYFGTPNVNLITALNLSLKSIIREGIDVRVRRHEIISLAIRTAIKELGLDMVPRSSFANTISAIYLPEKVEVKKFLLGAEANGVVFASGIIKEISNKYFRIGHMGSIGSSEVLIAIDAIERSLKKNGYDVELGKGIKAAQNVLYENDLGSYNSII